MPFKQEFCCPVCWGYGGTTGELVEYDQPGALVWMECGRCLERRLGEEAAAEELARREREKRRPRVCALRGCGIWFVPSTRWQRYCRDEHRWRAHRRRRNAAA
jgi:hypothetical protein